MFERHQELSFVEKFPDLAAIARYFEHDDVLVCLRSTCQRRCQSDRAARVTQEIEVVIEVGHYAAGVRQASGKCTHVIIVHTRTCKEPTRLPTISDEDAILLENLLRFSAGLFHGHEEDLAAKERNLFQSLVVWVALISTVE